MNKRKAFANIDADKDTFGSLPAFSKLDTWVSWLAWLKAIYALAMSQNEFAIYQQCTGRTQTPVIQPSETYTIVVEDGGWKEFYQQFNGMFHCLLFLIQGPSNGA